MIEQVPVLHQIREQPQPKTAQMERTAMEPWPTTVMHDLLVMQGSEIARLRAKLETSEVSKMY